MQPSFRTNMPETDEEKVQRYTESLMNGLDIKRALKRLFDLDVSANVFKTSDTYRFVKRYETSDQYSKYAIRVREKLRGLGIGIKRERESSEREEMKRPKTEEPTADELFAKAMGAGSSSSGGPRATVDYSKYKVTKRAAAPEPRKEPKHEPIDREYEAASSSSASGTMVKKPKEYTPNVPVVKPAPRNNHPVPQSASLRVDESQFKPRKDRQKVFAGRRKKIGEEVPSLISMCQDVLASNVHTSVIEHVGVVPYELLKPALLNATVDQLRHIADCNPMLVQDIDTLFHEMVRREFPSHADRDPEDHTWRYIYDKLVSKKQKKESAKLSALTARIGKAQKSQDTGRKTMVIDMAHTRVKSKSFFTNARDTQVKMLNTPSAIQLSQARKHVKTEGKAQLASITPRGGLGTSSRSRQPTTVNGAPVKKTAPLMAKCRKMLKR